MEMSLFDDEYNDHEIAWFGKDWDLVKKLSDEYKEKPENVFFELLNSINVTKQDINVSQLDYSKMMIENALSQHPECMTSVYVMNLVGSKLSDQSHFNYLKCSIPAGKRYGKWAKLTENSKDLLIIKIIQNYYKINYYDAIMYKNTLSEKNNLKSFLKKTKGLVTDELVQTITKNIKEQKELKKLALEW